MTEQSPEEHGLTVEPEPERRRMFFYRNDAARLLGVSPSTIDRWRLRGWLPVHENPEGVYTYHRDDLMATMTRAQAENPKTGQRLIRQPMKRAPAGVVQGARRRKL